MYVRFVWGACLRFFLPGLVVLALGRPAAAQNLIAGANNYETTALIDNPWGGVSNGVLSMVQAHVMTVDDLGRTHTRSLGAGVAVGDLNGDGLPDLVVADAAGYFWLFLNHGTAKQAKFTSGEIIPIWVGAPTTDNSSEPWAKYVGDSWSNDQTGPRIQLVDPNHDGVLSLLVGNFIGQLFYFHNAGSRTQPVFAQPNDLSSIEIPTTTGKNLWCNLLAPFLFDWTGSGKMDLILGEGTYSANSVYYLKNKGSNISFQFGEDATKKIIPGLGRECLTPQVVDWNHDGKPDILVGVREGFVDAFLNTGTDADGFPTFDQGQHVKFGGAEKLPAQQPTIAVSDLNGNGLPNLVVGLDDQRLYYAENKGTLGAPALGAATPIPGVNALPKTYNTAPGWWVQRAFNLPYFLLTSTDAQTEPGFTPPAPGFTRALKLWTVPHQNPTFPKDYVEPNDTHAVAWGNGTLNAVVLLSDTHYRVSGWVKSSGDVHDIVVGFHGDAGDHERPFFFTTVSSSDSWSEFSGSVEYEIKGGAKNSAGHFYVVIGYNGLGALYFDGLSCVKE